MQMKNTRRSLLTGCAGILGALAITAHAAYPDRPIRLIVPFSAGGTVDAVARTLGAQLSQVMNTPVLIENVPGAGGALATQRVIRSTPDGYT